jgi:activating signal cointegrator complex subunit 1
MDPLRCHLYELKGRIYRRNVPFDQIARSNPAVEARLCEAEEDEAMECGVTIGGGGKDYDGYDHEESTADTKENDQPVSEVSATKSQTSVNEKIAYNEKKKCWQSNFAFPPELYGRLLGSRGVTKRRIEESTNCKVNIPKRNEKGPVYISSSSRESVERCCDQIELILLEARKTRPLTHFVTFDLSDDTLKERYDNFVSEVMALPNLPEELRNAALYMRPEKLHLTISALWLLTEEDERTIKNTLSEIVDRKVKTLIDGQNFTVKIQGLGHFGDEDISAIKVLYAKVHSEKLQEIADIVATALEKTNLAQKRQTENVKLHMTVINTRYANTQSNEKAPSVDATELFKNFGDYHFGDVSIDKIRICRMHSEDPYTKGYPIIFQKDL